MRADAAHKWSERYLIGYSDRWSVCPGDRLQVMVSTSCDTYQADVVQLGRPGDPQPQMEPVAFEGLPRTMVGRHQQTTVGSCVAVDGIGRHVGPLPGLTITLWMLPTVVPHSADQTLVSFIHPERGDGWRLTLRSSGRLCFGLMGAAGELVAELPQRLARGQWHEVRAGYCHRRGVVSCAFRTQGEPDHAARRVEGDVAAAGDDASRLLIAAELVPASPSFRTRHHFNGRIEDVVLRAVDPDSTDHEDPVDAAGDTVIAAWDFSIGVGTSTVTDCGPNGLDGVTVNMPTRAVPGRRWTGHYLDYRATPSQYGAMHFHDDDLADAGWDCDVEVQLPETLPSGAYAARLTAFDLVDYVPFVVCPPADGPRPAAVVVLPTLTYLAYANNRVAYETDWSQIGTTSRGFDPAFDVRGLVLREHPEWGKSLYDRHTDGTGVIHSSRARPVVNFRPDYADWTTGGPRHFSADLHLLAWLSRMQVAHDVITDDELDAAGVEALRPYAVVLTGSHPEYCTERMLDALETYVDSGGNLMYLGGNGYYWVTSIRSGARDAIEVRRGNSGTRPWDSEPGTMFHATTGEPGGLWRHRGRPPNRLTGVGFAAQGWDDKAGYFERTAASFEAEHAWVFEGVRTEERIGDFGFVMNGAAGDELDKYSVVNGSPHDAVLLASSHGHGERYCVAVEEVREITPSVTGTTTREVRADMVYHRRPSGGAVFSVGSICWIASLLVNAGSNLGSGETRGEPPAANNVARVTANVLQRFMLPRATEP